MSDALLIAGGIVAGVVIVGAALWWAFRPAASRSGKSILAKPSGDDPDRRPIAGMGPD